MWLALRNVLSVERILNLVQAQPLCKPKMVQCSGSVRTSVKSTESNEN
jgi:hypothetical protein